MITTLLKYKPTIYKTKISQHTQKVNNILQKSKCKNSHKSYKQRAINLLTFIALFLYNIKSQGEEKTMFKVLKNLKKTWLSVVIIVILLCVQAWADLELPSYTSKIVNIGIQQGGIENVSPVIIRKSQLENLLIFTSDDEKILD